MVYIKNLIHEHKELNDGYEIIIRYKSGARSILKKTDKIQKMNGDLKMIRYYKGEYLCTVYIDCAEVESFSIGKSEEW